MTSATRHLFAEKRARGGIGQAGVAAEPFAAWIDDWRMEGDLGDLTLSARTREFAYELRLRAGGPLILHGADGYSVKSEAGQASYYYSQPFYRVSGTVRLDGAELPVTGRAWLDREWSTRPLTGDQQGWDWVSLHLGGGAKLMLYRLRHRDGADYMVGTWIGADGTARALSPGEASMIPEAATEVDGRAFPTSWTILYPAERVDLSVTALNPQARMATLFDYWEGPVTITGSHDGVGYLEMTGY